MTNLGFRGDGNRHLGDRRHLFDEPNAAALKGKTVDDPVRLMSAATFLEAALVIEAHAWVVPEAGSSIFGCTGQRSKYSRWTEHADGSPCLEAF
jgi:hypothetical protein